VGLPPTFSFTAAQSPVLLALHIGLHIRPDSAQISI